MKINTLEESLEKLDLQGTLVLLNILNQKALRLFLDEKATAPGIVPGGPNKNILLDSSGIQAVQARRVAM